MRLRCVGKPVILDVCDDPDGMRRIERELRARYKANHRIVCDVSAETGSRSNTLVTGGGARRLEHLTLEDASSKSSETVPAAALFALIGEAEPRTGWLPAEIERGEKGFVATGQDLMCKREYRGNWLLKRPPLPLETSMADAFAVGDVRYRSLKRVASVAGESSIAVRQALK